MQVTLNSNGPVPSQTLNAKATVASTYNTVSKLLVASADNKALVGFFRLIASEAMLNILKDDDEDKIAQTVGDKATNLARMNFFVHVATLAKADAAQQTLAIELLRAAAYFGSGRACQSLIEANESGVITLTEAEICDLVETQIFWHEEAQKTNSPVPAEVQTLPVLINLKKAWAAVYKKPELFNQLLAVAYLKSGVDCQSMLDANEVGTIKLTNVQVRQLIQQQIILYRAFSATMSRDEALQHAPKLLTQSDAWKNQPKAWAAVHENAKESFKLFSKFNDFLTTQLPEAEKVETLEALVQTTESEPGRFVGHFEDPKATSKKAVISAEDNQFNALRKHNLLALVELRQDVAKKPVRDIYDMRPRITAKREANVVADEASRNRGLAEERRLDALDEADLLENPNPAVTIKYIGQGKGGVRNMFDRTIGKTVIESRVDFDKKVATASTADKTRYTSRLSECETAYAQYQQRKAGRAQELVAFLAQETAGCEGRALELVGLENHEKSLITEFHVNNPLSACIRDAVFAMTRDLAVYGTVTYDWLNLIARMVAEDAYAYRAGTTDLFGYEGVKGAKNKNERLPVFIAANEPAYLTLLNVFLDANPGLINKKVVTDFTSKVCLDAFLKKMQDVFLAEDGSVITVNSTAFLVERFPLNEVVATKKDPRKQETTDAVTKYTVRTREQDPLLVAIESLKLTALLFTVTNLFPSAHASYTDVMKHTDIHSDRLMKLVVSMDSSSRLRNYLMMALVAMHNQSTLEKLSNLQDVNNPLNQYEVLSMDKEVAIALKALVRTNYLDIGVSDLDNAVTLLTYLKEQLESVDEVAYLLNEGALVRLDAEIKAYNQKGKGVYVDPTEAAAIRSAAEISRSQRVQSVQTAASAVSFRRESSSFPLPTTLSPVLSGDVSRSTTPDKSSDLGEQQMEGAAVPMGSIFGEELPASVGFPMPAALGRFQPLRTSPVSPAPAEATPREGSPVSTSPISDDMSESTTAAMERLAALKLQQAAMEEQLQAQQLQFQAQQAQFQAQMQEAERAKLKVGADNAEKPASAPSFMAVVLNKTTGEVSEHDAASFSADDNNAIIGMGVQGTEAYSRHLANAGAQGQAIIARKASFLAQLQKPKLVQGAVLVSKISTGKIAVVECLINDSRTKSKDYTFIGSAELGSEGYQTLIESAKGLVKKETMLADVAKRRASVAGSAESSGSDSDSNSDSDAPAKKPALSPAKAATPLAAKKADSAASNARPPAPPVMMQPKVAAAPAAAPVEEQSPEPKKLSMKERAALLGLGGNAPAAKQAAEPSKAKPSAPPASKAKAPSKWVISEEAANANAASAAVSKPSLAGLFAGTGVKPTDDGSVLAAVAKK